MVRGSFLSREKRKQNAVFVRPFFHYGFMISAGAFTGHMPIPTARFYFSGSSG